MKRTLFIMIALGVFISDPSFAQTPVTDDEVIPVGMSLKKELRFQLHSGGNIEFIFSNLSDYRNGVNSGGAGANVYETNFSITSTQNWELIYGSEDGDLIGSDNPANTLNRRNVGWSITVNGNHTCGNELDCSPTWGGGGGIQGLDPFPTTMITNGSGNAGDATDNDFTMVWRAGTAEAPGGASTSMIGTPILDQSPSPQPDRYITNVLFDLRSL